MGILLAWNRWVRLALMISHHALIFDDLRFGFLTLTMTNLVLRPPTIPLLTIPMW